MLNNFLQLDDSFFFGTLELFFEHLFVIDEFTGQKPF